MNDEQREVALHCIRSGAIAGLMLLDGNAYESKDGFCNTSWQELAKRIVSIAERDGVARVGIRASDGAVEMYGPGTNGWESDYQRKYLSEVIEVPLNRIEQ